MKKFPGTLLALLLTGLTGVIAHADSNLVRTEIRDELRGVSLYSAQISEDQVNKLTVVQGAFADSDRLALGLSAALYDGADDVEEFVFWLRHEGRRWLTTDLSDPVAIQADGQTVGMELLRAPRPTIGPNNRFFEKFEFRFKDRDLAQLTDSQQVVVSFRSTSGIVEKRLTTHEIAAITAFLASVASRS